MKLSTLASFNKSHFIAIMGQSNAAGFQAGDNATIYPPRTGQYIFNNVAYKWQPLQQNLNNGGAPFPYTGSIGMEMKLMQLLYDHYGVDQYLFKYAMGNTPIGPKSNGESYDWVPNTTENYMFNGCVNSFRNAISTFPTQIPKVKILIWVQGENDTTIERANNYQADFVKFITELKNKWNTPNLKILQTLLSDTQTSYNELGKSIVNNAKINYSINGNKYVSTDGAASDSIHFTVAGQEYIAKKVFDKLITML